jgi:hypothetical protein
MVRCATASDLTAVYELISDTSAVDLNKSMFARTFVN